MVGRVEFFIGFNGGRHRWRRTLFRFDKGHGFYTFANPESKLVLSNVEAGADSRDKCLKVECKLAGNSAYAGFGTGFDYLPKTLSDWSAAGPDGGLAFYVKADNACPLELMVYVGNKNFQAHLAVPPQWTRVMVPFRHLKCGEVAFDPVAMTPQKLEFRPPAGRAVYLQQIDLTAEKTVDPPPPDRRTLFAFNEGVQFYPFKNPESTVKLTRVDTAPVPGEKSLGISYKCGEPAPFVGVGIGFDYLPKALSDWSSAGTDGNFYLIVKADRPGECELNIQAGGKTFQGRFPVAVQWTRAVLPFRYIFAGKTPFAPATMTPQKMEIRLPDGKEPGVLYLYEIGLSRNKVIAPADLKTVIAGQIAGSTVPVTVKIQRDSKDRYGWDTQLAITTDDTGNFRQEFAFAANCKYVVEPLEKTAAPVEPVKTADCFFIEWKFSKPFEFDEIRLVNAGFNGGDRKLNTRSGRVMIKTGQGDVRYEFKNNSDDIITVKCGTRLTASAFRLEITDGAQPGGGDCAQIREIEFYRQGQLQPLNVFDYEKLSPVFRDLKANSAADDPHRQDFAVDGNRETSWRTMTKAIIMAKAWQPSYRLEITAPGMQTVTLPVSPATPEKYAQIKVVMTPVKSETATVTVNPAQVIREINPLVYGANMGLWHNGDLSNPAIIAAAKEVGVTLIRYPGGGRSQTARWQRQEAVWNSRPADGHPGYDCVVTPVQIDRFISFCRQVGAEPLFTVNQCTGDSANLVDLVKYLNVEKKYGVKYFEVGNEPEGYISAWGFGQNWVHNKDSFNKTYTRAAEIHLAYDKALKAIDPSIKLLGPVTANADFFELALPPFWNKMGEQLDILAVHRYPQCDLRPGNACYSDEQLLAKPTEWAQFVHYFEELNRRYEPSRRIPYAVTEWHTAYHSPGPRQQQIAGALYVAKNLGEMVKSGIDMATIWVLTGCGPYNLFNPGPEGKLEKVPTYYLFQAMATNLQGRMVSCTSNRKLLSVYAALKDGTLTVICINTAPDTKYETQLRLPEKWRLQNVRQYDSFNAGQPLDCVAGKMTVRAYGLTVLKFISVEP